jgi:hypothetical protein
MQKTIENLNSKIESLVEAISYPPYKELVASKIIEIDSFNYEEIKENLVNAVEYVDGEKLALIDEIMQILDNHQLKFHIQNHNYIGIYWRGLPMIIIKTKGNATQNTQTMMYISVKTYKDELSKRNNTKLGSRIVYGLTAAVVGTCLLFTYTLWGENINN